MRVRLLSAAAIVAAAMFGSSATRAETIDLGFALDSSGSIGSAGWALERNGLAAALLANIPTSNGTGKNSPNGNTYVLSVVAFDDQVRHTVTATITDQASLIAFTNTVTSWGFSGGSTCISCATTQLTTNFGIAALQANKALINISTDGEPNVGVTNGATLQSTLKSNGWDGLSAEAIGSFNTTFLNALAYPTPVTDTSNPASLPDPFTNGFVLAVSNTSEYGAAIDAKVANIVNVPVGPAGSGLPGLLAALGCFAVLARYRRRAAAPYVV